MIFLHTSSAETVTTRWGGDAEMVYNTGFANSVMKNTGGGVCLFNIDLIENDSPGSGRSEKGVGSDTIWGRNMARKIFYLDDPRAHKAWLVIFIYIQGERWTWFLESGRNTLRVRAVNKLGAKGKPSVIALNHADASFGNN